jgi:DNA-directed RNA polymerase III subunit RPC1
MDVTAADIKERILEVARKPMSPLRGIAERHLEVFDRDSLHVLPTNDREPAPTTAAGRAAAAAHLTGAARLDTSIFNLQALRTQLLDVIIHGVSSVRRVIVTEAPASKDAPKSSVPRYLMLAETADMRRVMVMPGVDGLRTTCNHVATIEETLGIEAARQVIVQEIQGVMSAYSVTIDVRHIYVLADVMTHRGVVLGITRYGIQKMNSGVLTMASFERTTEHLYDAAVHQRSDRTLSVSESIIVGAPVPLGTNSFGQLLQPAVAAATTAAAGAAASLAVDAATAAPSTGVVSGGVAQLQPATRSGNPTATSGVTGSVLLRAAGRQTTATGVEGATRQFRSIYERSALSLDNFGTLGLGRR